MIVVSSNITLQTEDPDCLRSLWCLLGKVEEYKYNFFSFYLNLMILCKSKEKRRLFSVLLIYLEVNFSVWF